METHVPFGKKKNVSHVREEESRAGRRWCGVGRTRGAGRSWGSKEEEDGASPDWVWSSRIGDGVVY